MEAKGGLPCGIGGRLAGGITKGQKYNRSVTMEALNIGLGSAAATFHRASAIFAPNSSYLLVSPTICGCVDHLQAVKNDVIRLYYVYILVTFCLRVGKVKAW